MKKRWRIGLVLATMLIICTFGFSGVALAAGQVEYQELRMTEIREEPINFGSYAVSLGSFVEEIVVRLFQSGEPAVVFSEHVTSALDLTFVDGLLGSNWNLVGGVTLANESPSNGIWGFKYTGWTAKTGGIWEIFSELQPAFYNERGQWCLGLAYKWKANNT